MFSLVYMLCGHYSLFILSVLPVSEEIEAAKALKKQQKTVVAVDGEEEEDGEAEGVSAGNGDVMDTKEEDDVKEADPVEDVVKETESMEDVVDSDKAEVKSSPTEETMDSAKVETAEISKESMDVVE